jgi:hypothetical protein
MPGDWIGSREVDNCTRVVEHWTREVAKCSSSLDSVPGGRNQLWNVLGVFREVWCSSMVSWVDWSVQ